MNPNKYILPIALAAFTMSTATSSAVEPSTSVIRLHKLTVSLKAQYEGDYKLDKKNNGDEKESQKIQTKKISTKEILEGLVTEGVISSIQGWSLYLATNDNGEITGTYISKKANTPIDVSQYFDAYTTQSIEAFNTKYNAKRDVLSGSYTYKSLASVSLNMSSLSLLSSGIMETKTTISGEDLSTDNPDVKELVKSSKISDLSGQFEGKNEGLVTGSIKAGKGKDITVHP